MDAILEEIDAETHACAFAEIVMVLRRHPDWSDGRIAATVGGRQPYPDYILRAELPAARAYQPPAPVPQPWRVAALEQVERLLPAWKSLFGAPRSSRLPDAIVQALAWARGEAGHLDVLYAADAASIVYAQEAVSWSAAQRLASAVSAPIWVRPADGSDLEAISDPLNIAREFMRRALHLDAVGTVPYTEAEFYAVRAHVARLLEEAPA